MEKCDFVVLLREIDNRHPCVKTGVDPIDRKSFRLGSLTHDRSLVSHASGLPTPPANLTPNSEVERYSIPSAPAVPSPTTPVTPDPAVEECIRVIDAIGKGDFSQRACIPISHSSGANAALSLSINNAVERLDSILAPTLQVLHDVGSEGKLGSQVHVEEADGAWRQLVDSVNDVTGTHSARIKEIVEVCKAVAAGDLSREIRVDLKGDAVILKHTINSMVTTLHSFANEVTKVAHLVGTEGQLGVQAQVHGVGGTWAVLTDNVNRMAANLTGMFNYAQPHRG